MITVEGKKVDYMVREEPSKQEDSGWVFYGGGETQAYLDDPSNTSVFNVNTIANYDPDIIEFLTYPPGTEIERNKNGKLEVLDKNISKPEVIFFHPVQKGKVQLTQEWSIEVNDLLLRRFDKGSLVLWRPEFTIWLETFSTDLSLESRIEKYEEIKSKDAFNYKVESKLDLTILSYQLNEDGQSSYYLFGFDGKQEIHMSIYYDNEHSLEEIKKIKTTLNCKHV